MQGPTHTLPQKKYVTIDVLSILAKYRCQHIGIIEMLVLKVGYKSKFSLNDYVSYCYMSIYQKKLWQVSFESMLLYIHNSVDAEITIISAYHSLIILDLLCTQQVEKVIQLLVALSLSSAISLSSFLYLVWCLQNILHKSMLYSAFKL